MIDDHIYWLFSAAAQSIAAFVAFLLTGYALVYTLMESAREQDDTLEDIHAAMRKAYHSRLRVLAWITGTAIVLSLLCVFLNRWHFAGKSELMVITAVLDVTAIGGGLTFVISIVNPTKYERAAVVVLRERKSEFALTGEPASAAEFFTAFINLERILREYLQRKGLAVGPPGMQRTPSFRQMVSALTQRPEIASSFLDELMRVNDYRNLVFHGHVDHADDSMLKRVREAVRKIEQLE